MANIEGIGKVPELRKRITFTILMLAVYRIGVFISIPGVNREVMEAYVQSASSGFLGLFNMFSGGAIEQLSIFAIGIMPYISASIIIQLLTVVVPTLERLSKEGDRGRQKITQYTRYGTLGLATVQGMGIGVWLESLSQAGGGAEGVLHGAGWGFKLLTVVTLATGAMFIMWLGEQITERGIGNGISLIIFAGIVAGLPDALVQTWNLSTLGGGDMEVPQLAGIGAMVVSVIAVICFFEPWTNETGGRKPALET